MTQTLEQVIAEELTPKTIRFWGRNFQNFAPVLVDYIQGDGKALFFFTPLNTRPNYYLIRVDSDLEAMQADDLDQYYKILEEKIICEISDEFGDDYCSCEDEGFPVLSLSCGWTSGFWSS